ncbi:MAG: bifunctional diaminohydroxyphosphoribosylaminopyrimidine deaminase/5-amino-6-(5-phosphoribosylamino)uracil reductase RibD [Proteobacteria bacterium]|jgi:diaminohydroxyphosphoribosylaminopyrimidine deaminase/5-amino-6-(5-phosphoribosylamino)uracil reductase|nr:bifunctional diaminohydroxyphosphoribosylaminopyrimidine deaminase/5-amino-6-(5-phosphoribosylamino)uracil reductase RibD [Pseudomonadota bacterium]
MTDQKYMTLAINLANATLGQTSPNPCVGAVIVKNGSVIAYGAHLKSGDAHAEVNAINSTTPDNLVNSDLYITLEPCCHSGKTSPCTELIIKSKIKRVVVATLDPNPLVSGKGIKQLRDAGIEVVMGIMEQEAIELNKMFFYYISTKIPYITLKTGMSLDAKLATSSNESKWITNEESREDTHNYRHTHDAILVGINTIIADNPSLTTRLKNGGKHPIRIVLDTHLRTPANSKIANDNISKTIIITGNQVTEKNKLQFTQKNVEIISMPTPEIDIADLLKILGNNNITSILVEGGQIIHNSFLQQKLFNQLVIYIAPILIGGGNALNFFTGTGFEKLSEAVKLKITEIKQLDGDIKIVAEQNTLGTI